MTDSERLARLEALTEVIAKKLGINLDAQRRIDGDTYDRAIQALAAGNRKPLRNFIKRGGRIPT